MVYEKQNGVPGFECNEYAEKTKDYAVLIPIINEGDRIHKELYRAKKHNIPAHADIIICDGGSADGCTYEKKLKKLFGNRKPEALGNEAVSYHEIINQISHY